MTADRKALVFALSAVLLWSTVATAFKITLQYLSPLQMVSAAATISALVIGLWVCIQGQARQVWPTLKRHPVYFLCLGAINPAIYYLILFEAYRLLPASQAQPLNYTWAIALTLLAAVVLKQKIRKRDWAACLLGYLGVAIIATQGRFDSFEHIAWLGVGLALLSTFLWAGYWILNAQHQSDPVITLFLCFALAAPPLLLVATSLEGWSNIPWQGWLAVSYVGVFEMGITFVLWLYAMRLTSNTSTISTLIFLSPFISLLLLRLILDEPVGAATVGGLAFIVCGLLIQQWQRKESSPPPAAIETDVELTPEDNTLKAHQKL